MSEKERANQEIDKIEKNKSLTVTDKQKAINSVKSLTRTIDGLIDREKEKISEHYESQLLSQVKLSNINMKQTDRASANVFSDGQDLFNLNRSNEEIQNSGSFKRSQFKQEGSSDDEQRPLYREDF